MHLIEGKLVRPVTPFASTAMAYGVNTIGPPSVLSFVNAAPLFFNEDLVWLMDCEYYVRLLNQYGPPARVRHFNTIVRLGEHQLTNHISEHVKSHEVHIVLDAHPEYRRFRGLRTAWARGRRTLRRTRAYLPFSDASAEARAGSAFVTACTGQPPR
jgi:hypothetical protein